MNKQLHQYHPRIGYTFIPGIQARVDHESGGYLVKVNNAGFRCNRDVTKTKEPGKFRILVFGDSYTAGDGVSNGKRYSDLLEALIPDAEVLNFGLSGTGTDQQYLIFQEFARDIEYDLVIVGVLVENINRITTRFRPYRSASGKTLLMAKPYFEVDGHRQLKLFHEVVPKDPIDPKELPKEERPHVYGGSYKGFVAKVLDKIGGKRLLDFAKSKMEHYPEYRRANSKAWLLMKAILKQWTDEILTRTIILTIPSHYHYEGTSSPKGYQARFKELDVPDKVYVVDPLESYLAYPREERNRLRFEKDPHPSPLQHELLAKVLARKIDSIRQNTVTSTS